LVIQIYFYLSQTTRSSVREGKRRRRRQSERCIWKYLYKDKNTYLSGETVQYMYVENNKSFARILSVG
jgi:hypothetical protein